MKFEPEGMIPEGRLLMLGVDTFDRTGIERVL